MLHLKKYFTEGLIQMAILLSLCGVRVDVGLDSYLPPSLHEMILGPTSALTQTQFHNLRNRLEDGHGLHPKSVDLDGFFTTRRLLGWVHSLDRLQVPQAELETWLVQREPDPLPVERAPAVVERDRTAPPVENTVGLGILEEEEDNDDKEEGTYDVFNHGAAMDDEEEEEEEEDLAWMHRRHSRAEGGGRPQRSDHRGNNRELNQNEGDQTTSSLQECLRLLEETFPFLEEQQLCDVGGRRRDLENQLAGRDPQLSSIIPDDNPSSDLELHWQDLLDIMEPENTHVDMMTSFDHGLDSRPSRIFNGVRSEALQRNSNNHDNRLTETDQDVPLIEGPLQHGLLGSPGQSELEPALLPLTPSADLDDHGSGLNTRDTLKNSHVNPTPSLPDHMSLLAENPSEDFSMGLNEENSLSTLNVNLLTEDPVDNMGSSLCSHDLTPSSTTQDFSKSPPGVFLVDKDEDVNDEDGLPSPLGALLDDASILDEIRLLDLALEEGFSPEMAVKLEEEGYLDREVTQHEPGQFNHNITSKEEREDNHSGSGMAVTGEQGQPRRHQQDGEDEADSDSGLSLDFSHSPASPCTSDASSYSSSSSSSISSSSCVSAVGSPFSEDEDEDAEDMLIDSDMEVELTIKQEEQEEEEMGAVGGQVNKLLSPNYGDHKLFNAFPWLGDIDHDHTYNQHLPSASSVPLGKMTTKHTKSSPRHDNDKPYHRSSSRHITESKMWSRDEWRAKALKIPFSNELIVDLPVEEFNELLANYQLNEEQLTLVRDIRRRGKNKIAAQNCRQRKLGLLVGLEENVSGLRRHRSRLLREKQEALRNLQEMKRRLNTLYQEVFSRLRDEEGRLLNNTEHMLNFGSNGSVTVAPRQQGAGLPLTGEKSRKKQRDKKK
ncbi:endoplasmic reticulum membrane sensor NFE2L1a [Scomber scombrus]|uniref:endoplasmic reticulum membrane sensor NFE2L1a n=1 Tax=Scomber scombrus TaxID=13677 RepID=UPI002DDA8767|nr:endoplasmic reticulum membrane sensor NFE2L1a [Scomber scombrus]